jgi:hypothetical protein
MSKKQLIILGVFLLILPFGLAWADATIGVSEGANIGIGLIGLAAVPAGVVLIIIGLLRPKKSQK